MTLSKAKKNTSDVTFARHPSCMTVLQASAFTEAKLKMSDVTCALNLCSVLHQRYADFAPALLENWQKVLLTKKDDKVPI